MSDRSAPPDGPCCPAPRRAPSKALAPSATPHSCNALSVTELTLLPLTCLASRGWIRIIFAVGRMHDRSYIQSKLIADARRYLIVAQLLPEPDGAQIRTGIGYTKLLASNCEYRYSTPVNQLSVKV